ncbi:MAG: DUF2273 domain-containing protein [bacterium]|nr:DUF2273 domain-containing protein [bacterium]
MKEIEKIRRRLTELMAKYPNRFIGAIIGFLAGLLLIVVIKLLGFFGALFIVVCIGVGFLIGKKREGKD